MAENDLAAFRERWKRELRSNLTGVASSSSRDVPDQSGRRDLKNKNEPLKPEGGERGAGGEVDSETEDQPEYVSIARSLLDGRTSPLLDRIEEERTKRKRLYQNMTSVCSASLQQQRKVKKVKEEELVDQLIQDLVGCSWCLSRNTHLCLCIVL